MRSITVDTNRKVGFEQFDLTPPEIPIAVSSKREVDNFYITLLQAICIVGLVVTVLVPQSDGTCSKPRTYSAYRNNR